MTLFRSGVLDLVVVVPSSVHLAFWQNGVALGSLHDGNIFKCQDRYKNMRSIAQ